jgi:hypothetical protein
MHQSSAPITEIIGGLPYRMAFAGGWIDQPFLSRENPTPPGSMVVVSIEPTCLFMDRCGMGPAPAITGGLWGDRIPPGDPTQLVRDLYIIENQGKTEPSGSQDMAGLVYPGISRLDYDFSVEGGLFPAHVENCDDAGTASWLSQILFAAVVDQRIQSI